MNNGRSPTLSVRVQGDLACFTRPELKAERVSYPVMTPSAARGVLEAVCWKPAIAWRIERIQVLREIRFTSFLRNEVNSRAIAPSRAVIAAGGEVSHYCADEDRAQRNTIALYDVDYVIEARFDMTDRAGDADNVAKFVDMFSRRVAKGQHFHQPYLGCREFIAQIRPADNAPAPIDDNRELGLMLWDMEYHSPDNIRPVFFAARLDGGVLNVPEDPWQSLNPTSQGGAQS